MEELSEVLKNVRKAKPIVHFITNYVTANDCANITLAAGGFPIMADEPREAEEITEHCNALVLNLGTINDHTIKAMLLSGKQANKLNIPIILDPVAVEASMFRSKTVATLLRELNFAVIKGNISEMKFLGGQITDFSGVSAYEEDLVTEENLADSVQFAIKLSAMAGSVVVITGGIDIIAGRREAYIIRSGSPLMAKVSGTGCMLGALIASYAGANPQSILPAAIAAAGVMSVAGQQAQQRAEQLDLGVMTYRALLTDYVGKINAEALKTEMKLEHVEPN